MQGLPSLPNGAFYENLRFGLMMMKSVFLVEETGVPGGNPTRRTRRNTLWTIFQEIFGRSMGLISLNVFLDNHQMSLPSVCPPTGETQAWRSALWWHRREAASRDVIIRSLLPVTSSPGVSTEKVDQQRYSTITTRNCSVRAGRIPLLQRKWYDI